jgi:hypothetical protein
MQVTGRLVPSHLADLLRNLQPAEQHRPLRQLNAFAVATTLRHRCHALLGIIFVKLAATELLRILTLAHAIHFWFVWGWQRSTLT